MKRQPYSGELNQKIKIMTPGDIPDGAGGTVPGDVLYWETSAKVKPLRSSRSLQANQEVLRPSMMFVVRYRNDKFLREDMVILWRGERYTILTAEPDFVYKEFTVISAMAQKLPGR